MGALVELVSISAVKAGKVHRYLGVIAVLVVLGSSWLFSNGVAEATEATSRSLAVAQQSTSKKDDGANGTGLTPASIVAAISLATAVLATGKSLLEFSKVRAERTAISEMADDDTISVVSVTGDSPEVLNRRKWWYAIVGYLVGSLMGFAVAILYFFVLAEGDPVLQWFAGCYGIGSYVLLFRSISLLPHGKEPWCHSRAVVLEGARADILNKILLGLRSAGAKISRLDESPGVLIACTGKQKLGGKAGRERLTFTFSSIATSPERWTVDVKSESIRARKLGANLANVEKVVQRLTA